MSRLTVLQYITPSRLGGAEEAYLNIVRDQKARGHRVIAVTKRDAALRPMIENCGVEVRGWHTHGKADPQTLSRLCRLIRRERVDVIHTHLTTASWLGALAGKLTRKPVIAHVHAADAKTWFQFADYFRAVAWGVQKHLVAQGVAPEKIAVVYYGIEMKNFDGAPSRADSRRNLGVPPDAPVVGVVASLQERKGHRFLLQALKNIEAKFPDARAIFAGEGPEEAALRQQARELGLENRVHFVGFRPDVREVLAACDAFALPSRKEGLSIAVMEAMAMGVPVVTSDIAGMSEVVRDGETGLLVPPFEVEPLANALSQLWNDKVLAQRLAENARVLLGEQFDLARCLGDLEEFQRNVVSGWRGKERFRCDGAPANL